MERVNQKLQENVDFLREAVRKRDTIHLDEEGNPIEENKSEAEIHAAPPIETDVELKEVPIKEADKPKED